jgi:hypothetical protein
VSAERLPSLLLRVSGAVLFAGGLLLYLDADYSVLALVLLFLVPDLSFAGYLAGPRAGAIAYNLAHALPAALALATVGVLAEWPVGVQLGLIWTAHVGIDWALGYGFKYPSGFGDTHMQRV